MSFPFDQTKTLLFICYYIQKGHLTSTIEGYLSGIRQEHLVRGWDVPCLRPSLVKSLLTGNRNLTKLTGKGLDRVAVEPADLVKMKQNIKGLHGTTFDKRLIYTTMLLLFYGSLRVHEVLSENATGYDPFSTLTWSDIRESRLKVNGKQVSLLILSIKSPKEAKGKTVTVEIFENKTSTCPVQAFRQLKRMLPPKASNSWPFSTKANGLLLTGKEFNSLLKDISVGINKGPGRVIRSHSFRAGIPTLMARAGYPDNEIQRQGRWRSNAFVKYCHLGRHNRWKDQLELAQRVPEMNTLVS